MSIEDSGLQPGADNQPEQQEELAESFTKDPDYLRLAEEEDRRHKLEFYGTTNFEELSLESFRSISNSDDIWRYKANLPKKLEQAFRTAFPEKAALYDQKERVRVYKSPDGTPDLRRDPAFEAIMNPVNQYQRPNFRYGLIRFAEEYPEKAAGYAESVPELKEVLNEKEFNQPTSETVTEQPREVPSLETAKRPYTETDISNLQRELAIFDQRTKAEGADYVLNSAVFYDYLANGSFPFQQADKGLTPEADPNPQEYASLILGYYKKWRQTLVDNQAYFDQFRPDLAQKLGDLSRLPDPQNIDELRAAYRNNQALNTLSAVSYQEGLGEEGTVNSPFLHFHGNRESGYQYNRPPTEVRLYLNPTKEDLPKIAKAFLDQAVLKNVPYYFKLVDFTLPNVPRNEQWRRDRLIFYTDKKTAEPILQILTHIQQEHPEWFQDRELPGMAAPLMNGVGFAEDPDQYQNEKFAPMGEKKTSFNHIRSKFLFEVWREATREIIQRAGDVQLSDGRRIREIYESNRPRSLNDDEAVSRTMVEVLPKVKADSLKQYIDKQIHVLGPKYHIDPENLARNKG